jgi:hypothetical protein
MNAIRILALVAAGLITAFLFVAIANGAPIERPHAGNTNEMHHHDRATLP